MADVIQLLPDSVANQIAAGEVVQRPASIVKELMENAIDAAANEIKVFIKNAGKTSIQIVDDGTGMSDTDARLSFERHATSKVRKAEDLFALHTMGFRGEALASIAAISQVEMKTCLADKELGVLLVVEGAQVKRQEQEACRKGTSIQVKNIFFNVPARRAFLKSNTVEMKHIVEEFQHLAIAYPEKSFELINDEKTIHELRPEKLSQRIVALFGKPYQQQLAPCKEETTSLRITGYVGKPESAKKTRGHQYLFVNNRYIRSNYINHAIAGAFEGLLPKDSYPFYVLFLEIDPRQIDVNIHPTKTEIKFEDMRTIYAIIQATVKKALGLHNLAPSLDFQADINLVEKSGHQDAPAADRYLDEQFGSFSKKKSPGNWQTLFSSSSRPTTDRRLEKTIQLESAVNQEEDISSSIERGAFQCYNKYIIRELKQGLIIIDQQAAHEKILYEQYISCLRKSNGESQQSLFPQTIELSTTDFMLVKEIEEEVKSLGFRFEFSEKNTVVVSATPPSTLGKEKEIFENLLEQFKENKSKLSLPLQENLAWSLAKKAAIRQGQKLEKQEIDMLVENFFSCNTTNLSVQGKPIFITLEISKIEGLFTP